MYQLEDRKRKAIIYLPYEDNEKLTKIKKDTLLKFCKDNDLDVIKVIEDYATQDLWLWNDGTAELYDFVVKNEKDYPIILVYSIEDLSFCINDSYVKAVQLQDYGDIHTIKEGSFVSDCEFNVNYNAIWDDEEKAFYHKYLIKEENL